MDITDSSLAAGGRPPHRLSASSYYSYFGIMTHYNVNNQRLQHEFKFSDLHPQIVLRFEWFCSHSRGNWDNVWLKSLPWHYTIIALSQLMASIRWTFIFVEGDSTRRVKPLLRNPINFCSLCVMDNSHATTYMQYKLSSVLGNLLIKEAVLI